jgi:hypothetical protein
MVGKDNPLPTPSGIAFESVATGSYVGATATSWTHTVGASANCLLVAVNGNGSFPPSMSIDTGQQFTLINGFFYLSFGNLYYYLYGLMNPTPGTRTITVTIPLFGGFSCGGSSIAYSGVSGFAASGFRYNGTVTTLELGLPAFPGGVAVWQTNGPGWTGATQISRQNSGGAGWQESRDNTASAAATVKGTANAVLGNSVSIPAHDIGDVIVVFAYANGINSAPTPPAASGTVPAWTLIQGGGGNTNGSGVWRFTATANNHTSGTWGSCTGLIAVVIQGVHPTTPVGGFAQATANANSFSAAPAITQRVTNGSSCLLYFHGHRSNVTTLGAPPAGFTRRAEAIGSSGICLNTKDDTTTDGAAAQTDNGNGGYVGQTVEILANTAVSRNFSTTWSSPAGYTAVGVVLK